MPKKKRTTRTNTKQNSTSGLDCTELVEIIEACGANAVTTIRLPNGTEIDFAPVAKVYEPVWNPRAIDRHDDFHYKDEHVTLESSDEIDDNREDKKDSLEELKEDMYDLMLTDPLAFEQIQTTGDVLDGQ